MEIPDIYSDSSGMRFELITAQEAEERKVLADVRKELDLILIKLISTPLLILYTQVTRTGILKIGSPGMFRATLRRVLKLSTSPERFLLSLGYVCIRNGHLPVRLMRPFASHAQALALQLCCGLRITHLKSS